MRRIVVASEKGGVGKSTITWNLAGALSEKGYQVVLVDEDTRVRSCLSWAELKPVPFQVVGPEGAQAALTKGVDLLLVDSEGRPAVEDLLEMARTFDVLLIPTGTSRLEIASTLRLWQTLNAMGNPGAARVVVTRAAPVGRQGQDARDALRGAGVPVLNTVMRRLAAHERAAENGGLVRDVNDERAREAWLDVLGIAKEIEA